MYLQGDDQLVANNVIHDQPEGFGVQVYDQGSRAVVVGNTITHSGSSGIVLGGGGGVDHVRIHNILAFNGGFGIETDSTCPTASIADHNVSFSNLLGPFETECSSLDLTGGNLTTDPRFVDAANRDLHSAPAVRRSTTASSNTRPRPTMQGTHGRSARAGRRRVQVQQWRAPASAAPAAPAGGPVSRGRDGGLAAGLLAPRRDNRHARRRPARRSSRHLSKRRRPRCARRACGRRDTAVTLDGGNDQVNMHDPGGGGLDFGSADFTAEAWVRGLASDERTIFGKRAYGTPSPPFWQATVTDDSNHAGQVRVNVFDGAANVQVYGPVNRVDNGAWHHVVVVFDRDSGITVWVDESARRRPPSSPAA